MRFFNLKRPHVHEGDDLRKSVQHHDTTDNDRGSGKRMICAAYSVIIASSKLIFTYDQYDLIVRACYYHRNRWLSFGCRKSEAEKAGHSVRGSWLSCNDRRKDNVKESRLIEIEISKAWL